jgi:hypothetical protein
MEGPKAVVHLCIKKVSKNCVVHFGAQFLYKENKNVRGSSPISSITKTPRPV